MDVRHSEPNVSDHALIVGRYPLQSYVRFLRNRHTSANALDEQQLAQEWREIQQRSAEADAADKGIADNPQFIPLPDEMIPLALEARQQEALQKAYGARPSQWWLVEIDRTIVFQPWVDLGFVREFQATLPRPLSHEDHIRVSTGGHMSKPLVRASQTSEDRYVFTSRSTDVRFLGSAVLDASCIQNYRPTGYATHVVAVFLGSGVNCLSALHVNNRLILMNGTHRAYALRDLGCTHVACLVTHVSSNEEKAQLLPPAVKQDEPRYLTAARPPLFKDYFDPSVRRIIPTTDMHTLLRLKLRQSKESVPAS